MAAAKCAFLRVQLVCCFPEWTAAVGVFMVIEDDVFHIGVKRKPLYVLFAHDAVNTQSGGIFCICNVVVKLLLYVLRQGVVMQPVVLKHPMS